MIPAMKNPQTGFTIVELMVTLMIAGLLLAMAVPSYMRFVAGSRVTDQTYDLIGALNLGRSEAIRRNANVTLCRAADDTAVVCATGNANWQAWILTTGGGVVLRRGTLNNFSNTQHVSSTLDEESIVFGADGLVRTGGVLVGGSVDNSGADSDPHSFTICSTRYSTDNIRTLRLGNSSRISTIRESGTCT
jgi:type IV fimbrial biogenesis protein FimT